jgi:hypothetical protein
MNLFAMANPPAGGVAWFQDLSVNVMQYFQNTPSLLRGESMLTQDVILGS